MQQQTKLIFLFMFLWLVQKAQAQKDKRAESTVLKIDFSRPNYSSRQLNWFNDNGFETETYQWNSKEINLSLHKASNFNHNSRVTGWLSVGAILSGLLINGVVSIAESTKGGALEDNSARKMMNTLYISGAGLAVTSFVFSKKSRTQLNQAIVHHENVK